MAFYLLQFTWALTVNLAGLAAYLCCRARRDRGRFCNGFVTFLPGQWGGLSLGIFLFLSAGGGEERRRLCVHEYGHTIQCLLLGPLYWVVIALPSAIWYHCFEGFRQRRGVPYEALYCERWATAWGRSWSGI